MDLIQFVQILASPVLLALGFISARLDQRRKSRTDGQAEERARQANVRADATWWLDETRQLKQDLRDARRELIDCQERILTLEHDIRDLKAGEETRTAAAVAAATADLTARHQQDLADLTTKHQLELGQLADEARAQRAALQGQLELVQGQLDVRRQQQIAPVTGAAAPAPTPALANEPAT